MGIFFLIMLVISLVFWLFGNFQGHFEGFHSFERVI